MHRLRNGIAIMLYHQNTAICAVDLGVLSLKIVHS